MPRKKSASKMLVVPEEEEPKAKVYNIEEDYEATLEKIQNLPKRADFDRPRSYLIRYARSLHEIIHAR